MDSQTLIFAFQRAVGKWSGCRWPTRFGSFGLNLEGLKSSQAELISRSTAGEERAAWKAAAQWLEQVERDAAEAEREARLALELAGRGELEQALEHARRAAALESDYGGSPVWQPLCGAIAAALGRPVEKVSLTEEQRI